MDWLAAVLVRARTGLAKTYWAQAPQGVTRPYATLLDLTANRPQHLNGFELEPSRIQIDSWADSHKVATDNMELIIAALLPGGTFNGHKFQRADVALGPRDIAGERDGTGPVFRKSADLIIHHTTA